MSTNQNSRQRLAKIFALAAMITAISMFFVTNEHMQLFSVSKVPDSPFTQQEITPVDVSEFTNEPEFLTQSIPVIQAPPEHKLHKATVCSVDPPLENLLPEPEIKVINPLEGGFIECETGSVVQIPPNAFVDEKGKPVKDIVKLKFNEYHNYKEIFFSGIPMVYRTGGKENQFESAGMMQLEASADDKTVYMSPGSRIKILLASAERSKDYNLYYFDKIKGNWIEKGKDQVTYKKKLVARKENTARFRPFKTKKRAIHLTSFEDVPEDKVFLWWRSPATEFEFSFTLLSKSYPELKAFAATKWEYKGTDAKEVYARLFNVPQKEKYKAVRRGYWDSYSVELDKESITATFVFVNDAESITVIARPKEKGEKNLLKVRSRMNNYETAMTKRLKADDADYRSYQKDSVSFTINQTPVNETTLAVMRSFEIDNLGIWNVDKIADNRKFVAYNLRFVDENNNPIQIETVYLADKDFNSVFQYYSPSKRTVLLNPYSNNMLWAVLPGNRLAVAGKEQIWKLAGTKGKQKVVMKVKEDAVASIEDAREELNF